MPSTLQEYDAVIAHCRELFEAKLQDYGLAWRILRLPSLTDQIFIKAQRLRSVEEKKSQLVEDRPEEEYLGIFNYSVMALIQLDQGVAQQPDLQASEALEVYQKEIGKARELMQRKNHDYGEAWREMRLSSITDIILQKLLRIKQIENNQGRTTHSEGLEANYQDILNYAAFALIKMEVYPQRSDS